MKKAGARYKSHNILQIHLLCFCLEVAARLMSHFWMYPLYNYSIAYKRHFKNLLHQFCLKNPISFVAILVGAVCVYEMVLLALMFLFSTNAITRKLDFFGCRGAWEKKWNKCVTRAFWHKNSNALKKICTIRRKNTQLI